MTTLKSVKSNRKKLSKKKIFIKGSFKDKNGKIVKLGFRSGVPEHVPDEQAQELMNDVRKGMGINENFNQIGRAHV